MHPKNTNQYFRPAPKKNNSQTQMMFSFRQQQESQARFARSDHQVKIKSGRHDAPISRGKQLLALFFIVLLLGADAGKAENRGKRKQGDNQDNGGVDQKTISKQAIYKGICSDKSLGTYNKPNITLGIINEILLPKSCMKPESISCIGEQNLFNLFQPNYRSAKKLRDIVKSQYSSWEKSYLSTVNAIAKELNYEQEVIFDNIVNILSLIKYKGLYTYHAKQMKSGQCGEHSSVTLIKLINKKMDHRLNMKIQSIVTRTSNPKGDLQDHEYLLLDSDINDVEIVADVEKVKNTLNSISEGIICDTWNYGYFANFKTDDSGLYNGADWDSLSITTYSFDFSNFDKLSKKAQGYICQQLSVIECDLDMELGTTYLSC